jgi:hypothetical protein
MFAALMAFRAHFFVLHSPRAEARGEHCWRIFVTKEPQSKIKMDNLNVKGLIPEAALLAFSHRARSDYR